jgi:N-acetylmuramoyl-L-alanine amidase
MKGLLLVSLFMPIMAYSETPTSKIEDIICLAQNIYFEARNQSDLGKEAVAEVVFNRVKDERYPNTICSVVKQAQQSFGRIIINKCQFSWYCDGRSDYPKDAKSWTASIRIAQHMINNGTRELTQGSTHYHSVTVSPYWKESLNKIVQIDDHIFYKE